MKIAICQTHIEWEQKEKNMQKCQEMLKEANQEQADLVLFPEMSFTGFSMNTNRTAESGFETVECMCTAARENQIHIGFGWVNKVGEKAENHYSICNEKGEIILDYVKIHPFSFAEENQYFNSGKTLALCSIGGITLSVFICYDLRFPELFQAIPDQVSLVIVPANWPEKRRKHWQTLLAARAIENQFYMAGVNCLGMIGGQKYSGDSCMINPLGEVIGALSNQAGMLVFDIKDDINKYRARFPVRQDRRKQLYKQLYDEEKGRYQHEWKRDESGCDRSRCYGPGRGN